MTKKKTKKVERKVVIPDIDINNIDEEDIDLTISEPHMEIVLDNGRDVILRQEGKLYIVERYRTRYGTKYGLRELTIQPVY